MPMSCIHSSTRHWCHPKLLICPCCPRGPGLASNLHNIFLLVRFCQQCGSIINASHCKEFRPMGCLSGINRSDWPTGMSWIFMAIDWITSSVLSHTGRKCIQLLLTSQTYLTKNNNVHTQPIQFQFHQGRFPLWVLCGYSSMQFWKAAAFFFGSVTVAMNYYWK